MFIYIYLFFFLNLIEYSNDMAVKSSTLILLYILFVFTVQIDIPIDQEYLIAGGGLPGIYKMDQMHFHWASEHTIDTKR